METEAITEDLQAETNKENEDKTNQTLPIDEIEKDIVASMEENSKDTKPTQLEKNDAAVKEPKTLLDVVVDKKVEERLKSMQQKFDQELDSYRRQIEELQSSQ